MNNIIKSFLMFSVLVASFATQTTSFAQDPLTDAQREALKESLWTTRGELSVLEKQLLPEFEKLLDNAEFRRNWYWVSVPAALVGTAGVVYGIHTINKTGKLNTGSGIANSFGRVIGGAIGASIITVSGAVTAGGGLQIYLTETDIKAGKERIADLKTKIRARKVQINEVLIKLGVAPEFLVEAPATDPVDTGFDPSHFDFRRW